MYIHHTHTYIRHAATHTHTYNMQEYSWRSKSLLWSLFDTQTTHAGFRRSSRFLSLSLSLSLSSAVPALAQTHTYTSNVVHQHMSVWHSVSDTDIKPHTHSRHKCKVFLQWLHELSYHAKLFTYPHEHTHARVLSLSHTFACRTPHKYIYTHCPTHAPSDASSS